MKLHNPLPEDLEQTCTRSASILAHFIKGTNELDAKLIPQCVVATAAGVAIMTLVKAGVLWSGRAGTGLVVARLEDGSWSAPSMICAAGVGVGAQFGIQQTDVVFVLNTRAAVRAFSHGNLTLGGNISVAAGPTGRSSEAAGALVHAAPIYSYSKSKGFFVGVTLEGTMIMTRKRTNARFYGAGVTAQELLSGVVPPPAQAEAFYRMLNIKFGSLGLIKDNSNASPLDASSLNNASLNNTLLASNASNGSLNKSAKKTPFPATSTTSMTSTQARTSTSTCISTSTSMSMAAPPVIVSATKPRPTGSKPKKAIALFRYETAVAGDLWFEKGDVVWVSREMGEWSEGSVVGGNSSMGGAMGAMAGASSGSSRARKGIFPTSYVTYTLS